MSKAVVEIELVILKLTQQMDILRKQLDDANDHNDVQGQINTAVKITEVGRQIQAQENLLKELIGIS